MNLSCYDESNAVALTLNKVLHVPNLSKNLLSVPATTQTRAEWYTPEQNGVSERLNSPAVIDQKRLELFKLVIQT